jgi:hypothetical protein
MRFLRRLYTNVRCEALQTAFLFATLAASVATACRSVVEASLPEGAVEIVPPGVYARWWQLTQVCSGRSRDMSSVRWYSISGASFTSNGQEDAGLWLGNRIVLAGDEIYDGPVVRHEMLHALLETAAHPRVAFLGSCASVVACLSNCLRDAGEWRAPSSYELLAADSLDVGVDIELPLAEADGGQWLVQWVSVHNAHQRAVLAAAPGDPRTPETFTYQLWGPFGAIQGGLVALDSSTLFFEPGETKRWLFEFRSGPQLSQYANPITLPPGPYGVRGAYGRNWSVLDSVTLAP